MKTGILFIRKFPLKYIKNILKLFENKIYIKYIVVKEWGMDCEIFYKSLEKEGIILKTHKEVLNEINVLEKIDVIISYYYQKKIESIILEKAILGGINIHPAPLPYYRGIGNYSLCILENLNYWGVSAHYMTEKFDDGTLIKVNKFKIDSSKETYVSLEKITLKESITLLKEIIEMLYTNSINIIKINIETAKIKYMTKLDLEKLKKININDSQELIERKIRAFWKPPLMGATISINNKEYTLIDEVILKVINKSLTNN